MTYRDLNPDLLPSTGNVQPVTPHVAILDEGYDPTSSGYKSDVLPIELIQC